MNNVEEALANDPERLREALRIEREEHARTRAKLCDERLAREEAELARERAVVWRSMECARADKAAQESVRWRDQCVSEAVELEAKLEGAKKHIRKLLDLVLQDDQATFNVRKAAQDWLEGQE